MKPRMLLIPLVVCLGSLHAQKRAAESPEDVPQLETQAMSGNIAAQVQLARAHESGIGALKDDRLAVMWYRRAADQGNADAQDRLGEKYLAGEGVEKDAREAVAWFHKAARQGNSTAMYHLGVSYYDGNGVNVDYSLAYAWFRLAKEAGNQQAGEAVERTESEMKEQTITIGFEKIAEMYDDGQDIPQNHEEATRWWSMAAARGDEDGKVALALELVTTTKTGKDLTQARQLCNEAAKRRNHRAEYCMGFIYEYGLGVTVDSKKAKNWYQLAAEKGEKDAMRNLARMQAKGEGGRIDRVDAFLLYARLLELHDHDVLLPLANLRKELSPKEWQELQKPLQHLRIDPIKLDKVLQQAEIR